MCQDGVAVYASHSGFDAIPSSIGLNVSALTWLVIHVTQVGKKNRSVGSTLMNQDSSRSHSIFTITVECTEKLDAAVEKVKCVLLNENMAAGHFLVLPATGQEGPMSCQHAYPCTCDTHHAVFCIFQGNDDNHIRVGKLNLVDLAGSERQSKTGATGKGTFQKFVTVMQQLR